jgi:hypothetical protein
VRDLWREGVVGLVLENDWVNGEGQKCL